MLGLLCLISLTVIYSDEWNNWGGDITNRRYNPNSKILTSNIQNLTLLWELDVNANIYATPAISSDSILYFPSQNHSIYAIDITNGKILWKREDCTTRTTPVIWNDYLLFGAGNASVFALNRTTGATIWHTTRLDNALLTAITQSGSVSSNGIFLIGLTSQEEILLQSCCTFRGRLIALNATNGKILWTTYTVPASTSSPGYAGASIWGSSPAIDENLNLVFIATGNNHMVPPDVQQCLDNLVEGQTPLLCQYGENYDNSIVAIDLSSGKVVWFFKAFGADWWSIGCSLNLTGYCSYNSQITGRDYDFGQAPLLFTNSKSELLVGAGNKGGIFFALDRKTGNLVWSTPVGPGSYGGGMMMGSAADDKYIFTANSNMDSQYFTLQNGTKICTGVWTALDVDSGNIVWQTPDPNTPNFDCENANTAPRETKPMAYGPVSLGQGIVFGASYLGTIVAMEENTGKIIWTFETNVSIGSGGALVGEYLFWGTGYNGSKGEIMYAFSV